MFKIVYVLSNPAMPGLVKIGYTTQEDANIRIGQLYTTGVPVPFQLEYACRVENAEEVEKALHQAFSPQRINPKREFFQIDPQQAIAVLRLLHVEDATNEVVAQPTIVDFQSIEAATIMRARRPNLNFIEMGIPLGAELVSIHRDVSVVVESAKKVIFEGSVTSLTAATRMVLGVQHDVAPAGHWTYQGKNLRDIYTETYGE